MPDGAATTVASPRPDPAPAPLPRVRCLLGLVRTLVAYGTTLLATLQQRSSPHRCALAIMTFGTRDLARIIARITCGLQRAAALEARLERYVARGQDLPVPELPLRLSAPRAPQDAPSVDAPPRAARGTLSSVLPTAEEIAAQVRTRAISAVISDICRDLGLESGTMDAVIWQALMDAAVVCGITLNGVISRGVRPVLDDDNEDLEAALSHWPAAGSQVGVSGSARPP